MDVVQRHVPLAPLDPPDIVAMEASELGQSFLREPSLSAKRPDALAERLSMIFGACVCASHGPNVGTGR